MLLGIKPKSINIERVYKCFFLDRGIEIKNKV
nr:MAG TPA: hypothetical protein [Caudoviricetes sp.]